MNVKEVKENYKIELQKAVEKRVEKLKKTKEYKRLQKEVSDFEAGPDEGFYYLDEAGFLCSSLTVDVEFFKKEDPDVYEAVLQSITEVGFWGGIASGSIESTEDVFSICLGMPTFFNPDADRNEYAIYSEDLNLKVDEVINTEHGLLLIEQAMRRAGVFEYIVEVDRYGSIVKLWDTGLGTCTDAEIKEKIDALEAENED